jgi:hypothetical protein
MDPLVGGLIMGGISGITSIFGGNAQAKAQAGAQAYQNRLSQEQTRIQNSFKDRAFGRAVSTTKEQIGENLNAFSRATAQERARFNEQLYGFSTQRQSAIRDLIQTQGMANASERYGRSAGRMKSIEIMGNYGRNQRIFTDSVASAGRQYNRNQESFNQARYEADRQTVAGLANASDSFLPGMAQTSYTGGGNNSFLTIASGLMQGAQAGLNMYSSMGGTFGGGGGSTIKTPMSQYWNSP